MSTQDNVYVNVTINSDFSSKTRLQTQQYAEYDTTNTQPILQKCNDYYCSVLRFDFPLNVVPLWICPIVPLPNTNVNLTEFKIGINSLGVNYTQQLIFTPVSDQFQAPLVNNDPQNPYYWVYSYQTFIDMFNNALQTVFNATGLPGSAPYLIFDPVTSLISFILPRLFVEITPNKPIIYINEATLQYLDAFQVFWYGFNQPDGRDYDLLFNNLNSPYTYNNIPVNPPNQFIFTQDYSTVPGWSPLRKILITTNTIPIAYEWTLAGENLDTQFPILTDFVPQIEKAGQTRTIAYYIPLSQYRLVDLISTGPLQKIDIKVYWESTQGIIFPLIIPEFQQINIKLGFFKKSLYNANNLLTRK